jgi:hypothetical protein
LLEQFSNRPLVPNVELTDHAPATDFLRCGKGGMGAGQVGMAGNEQVGPFAGERLYDGPADAGIGAGNYGDLILEAR